MTKKRTANVNDMADQRNWVSNEFVKTDGDPLIYTYTRQELDLARQWFDAVQDTNPAYLGPGDYALAAKLYRELGIRIPNSIISQL